jgi:DNA primase
VNDAISIYEQFLDGIGESGDTHRRATCPCPKRSKRSFHFNVDTGYYGCWSCGDHGSLYRFLTEQGVETGRARQMCQDVRASAPAPEADLRKKQIRRQAAIDELPDYILAAFHNCPTSLVDAGFDEGLIERYEIGFDKLRNRITFPIRDREGRLVGISGRTVILGVEPKYKVYDSRPPEGRRPPGELFGVEPQYVPHTKHHVYGLHTFWATRAHKSGDGQDPIIITEGYKSTLWLRQLGFHYSVGLMGSEMTREQQKALSDLKGPFIVLLDHEPGKQIADPKLVTKRVSYLRAKNVQAADRIRTCAAVDIAKRLQQHGPTLLGVYPTGSKVGTAPDDLSKADIEYAIANAITPTVALLRGLRESQNPSTENEHGMG